MASPTRWTWVWVNSRSLWWTGRSGVLRFMGLQRVRRDWVTELNWWTCNQVSFLLPVPLLHESALVDFYSPPASLVISTLSNPVAMLSFRGFPGGVSVKNPRAMQETLRDGGLIPVSGRSPGREHSNLLQYSCLENPMDRGAWWAIVHRLTNSQTGLFNLIAAFDIAVHSFFLEHLHLGCGTPLS